MNNGQPLILVDAPQRAKRELEFISLGSERRGVITTSHAVMISGGLPQRASAPGKVWLYHGRMRLQYSTVKCVVKILPPTTACDQMRQEASLGTMHGRMAVGAGRMNLGSF